LQKDVNYLRQKDAAHKVLLFGAPRSADPTKLVELVAQKININITPSDISFCARLNKKNNEQQKRPPLILIGFSNNTIAEKFVSTQKKFGPIAIDQLEGVNKAEGEPSSIRTDYFLTHHFADLLKQAKKTKETLKYKFVWYKHGAVFLKKSEKTQPIMIENAKQLEVLETEAKKM
jgi:Baculovirus FP protein